MSTPPDSPPDPDPIRPSLTDVGAIDWARTRDDDVGRQTGTFGPGTHPTGVEVEAFIDDALDEVRLRIPAELSERIVGFARGTVALLVAATIERSYEPGTTAADDSAYAAFRQRYEERLALLMQATTDASNTTTETFGSVVAHTVGMTPDDWTTQAPDQVA